MMDEDVNETIIELVKLYNDGKNAITQFEEIEEAIIPFRSYCELPEYEFSDSLGIVQIKDKKPIPEHHRLQEMIDMVDEYAEEWIKSVRALLDKTNRVRFRLQFDEPDAIGSYLATVGSDVTEKEEHLQRAINDLSSRHAELRQIIIELEKTTEQIKIASTKTIKPVTYDKKNRTIFFANEAIRFRKDASYTAGVLAIIFDKPSKLWKLKDFMKAWDDYYEYTGAEKPNDWQKIHQTFKRINERVKKVTEIEDLFKFSTTSVRINPAYLEETKIKQ